MGPQNDEGEKGVFAVAKKTNYNYYEMHKQECNGESPVTELKGIGGQTILPFLETPGQYPHFSSLTRLNRATPCGLFAN